MRKFLIACFALLLFFNLSAAKISIAVIGDSDEAGKAADLIASKLSSLYAVSERAGVEKILKEQKLSRAAIGTNEIIRISKFLHVDFLVVVNSRMQDKKTELSGFLLFDAANGAKIIDRALPEDLEKAAVTATEEIKSELSKSKGQKKQKLLSVLSVRNAGAPVKYNGDFVNIALEVERAIGSAPGVAVLERENLGLVNQERKLSGTYSKLAPSGFFLDFEFISGSSADKVNLLLNILNASGKKIKTIKVQDCLKNKQDSEKTLLKELSRFLSVTVPESSGSPASEAARFFNEYKFCERIRALDAAERKLEAAIALNPDSMQYRLEMARFIMQNAKSLSDYRKPEESLNRLLDAGNKAIDIFEEVELRFPAPKKPVYSLYALDTLGNIVNNQHPPFSPATEAKITSFSSRHRKHNDKVIRFYHPFDLSDGINSIKEMKNFKDYSIESSMFHNYLDHKASIQASLKAAEDVLRYGGEFLKKNPDALKNMPYNDQIWTFVMFPQYQLMQNQIMENEIRNTEPLVTAAKDHPAPAAQLFGVDIDLFRKAVINNFDKEKFAADMDSLIETAEKLKIPTSPEAAALLPGTFSMMFFVFHRDLGQIYYWKQIEYARKSNQIAYWYVVRNYMQSCTKKDSSAILKAEPELSYWKNNKPAKDRDEIEGMLKHWSDGKNADEKTKEILKEKENVKIEKVFSVDHKAGRISGLCEENGKLYMSTASGKKSVTIHSFDPANGKATPVKNASNLDIGRASRFSDDFEVFSVSKKYILLGGDSEITVIPMGGGKPLRIKDLPAQEVNALAFMNGRIYAFLGRINKTGQIQAKETVLASFLPDGSDRKIHISTLGTEKKNELDKAAPFIVSNLFADPEKKRLLFTAENTFGAFWEFDVRNDQPKKLIDFGESHDAWAGRIGDTIYMANSIYRFYTFDIKDDQAKFIFFSGSPSYAKRLKDLKPEYLKEINVQPPFFCNGEDLWFGGYRTHFVNTKDLGNPEYIKLPDNGMALFYPHPDVVSVYAFIKNSIYKLSPR